ncbi:YjhX family toxin (plasmid) [Microbulbifer sp. MKSA007]|nr:YjhX family toxin [Microbulbifer sp. MKSA007]
MNISKHEQRVLHELALGGEIHCERDENGKLSNTICFSRDGHILASCSLPLFKVLKKKRLICSRKSAPYRISRLGVTCVRAQMNQR